MSPRKDRYQTPEWVAKSIRDRRKKILYGPYNCPVCMKKNLQINLDNKKRQVSAVCSCGFERNLKYLTNFEPIDYYSKMIDSIRKI